MHIIEDLIPRPFSNFVREGPGDEVGIKKGCIAASL